MRSRRWAVTGPGQIERRHQTLKNRTLLDNYFLLGGLDHQIEAFVAHYHASLDNSTPAKAC